MKPDVDEAPEVPRHRSTKNTKDWCRGRVGVPHRPVIVRSKHGFQPYTGNLLPCKTQEEVDERFGEQRITFFGCYHIEECVMCGKILKDPCDVCPDTGKRNR